jgi:fructokinase
MPLALGIDLGGTKIEAAVLAEDGQFRWRQRMPTPAGDYAATLEAVASLVNRAEAAAGPLASVGLGHPGTLTPAGRIKNANSTCLNGQPLQADLQARLGRPLRLANDANCLALSEAADGAAAGAAVVFAVILGTGVGGGLVVHGRVLGGANGLAGEWGHNPLPWADAAETPGPACYCGRRGCLETWLSGPGLARDHGAPGRPVPAIADAAASGDAAATASIDRHAHRLARGLAAVINLLDPDVIVLAGGVSQLPGLVERVTARWQAWVFSAGDDAPLRTRLCTARHGDASGVRGAARLWP